MRSRRRYDVGSWRHVCCWVVLCRPEARDTMMHIVSSIPNLRPLDGGSVRNAVGMETFAAILLTINVRHKMRASLRLITV